MTEERAAELEEAIADVLGNLACAHHEYPMARRWCGCVDSVEDALLVIAGLGPRNRTSREE